MVAKRARRIQQRKERSTLRERLRYQGRRNPLARNRRSNSRDGTANVGLRKNRPMRVIFSRKGFDSAAGNPPSPIIDGEPISLPIPTKRRSETSYLVAGLGEI